MIVGTVIGAAGLIVIATALAAFSMLSREIELGLEDNGECIDELEIFDYADQM